MYNNRPSLNCPKDFGCVRKTSRTEGSFQFTASCATHIEYIGPLLGGRRKQEANSAHFRPVSYHSLQSQDPVSRLKVRLHCCSFIQTKFNMIVPRNCSSRVEVVIFEKAGNISQKTRSRRSLRDTPPTTPCLDIRLWNRYSYTYFEQSVRPKDLPRSFA